MLTAARTTQGLGFINWGSDSSPAHDASDRPDPMDGQVFQDGVAGVVADDDDRPAGGGGGGDEVGCRHAARGADQAIAEAMDAHVEAQQADAERGTMALRACPCQQANCALIARMGPWGQSIGWRRRCSAA